MEFGILIPPSFLVCNVILGAFPLMEPHREDETINLVIV
jgi:hypothetical protein